MINITNDIDIGEIIDELRRFHEEPPKISLLNVINDIRETKKKKASFYTDINELNFVNDTIVLIAKKNVKLDDIYELILNYIDDSFIVSIKEEKQSPFEDYHFVIVESDLAKQSLSIVASDLYMDIEEIHKIKAENKKAKVYIFNNIDDINEMYIVRRD